MRLLFITPGKLPVPATKGGAVETLIQTLIDNNEKTGKYEITLITSYDIEAENISNKYKNTKFIFIPIDDKRYKFSRIIRYLINRIPGIYIGNAYISRVYKILRENKSIYDYIIIENSPEYALLLKKNFNNLILHIHNDFLNKDTNMAIKILNSYIKVLSLSNFISNRIGEIDKSYLGISTLYNGIVMDKFSADTDSNLKEKLGINESDFIYIYTGRIVEVKGVRELVKSFNLINDPTCKLLIVGDIINVPYKSKKYIKEIKKICKKNSNIIITGGISYEDIPSYYKIGNVGIVPSIWEEPFALTVIEHMAVGNPVIISNSGAMPELVNEECAIIVDKKNNYEHNLVDAMIRIKKNYKNYNKEKIMEQSRKFNSEIYCNRFDELIKKGE